ncbi:MAG: DUF6481 family protein [Fuscovulum sp.]|nr:MAG: DUF6481 family protein [Fuscovulum sp.]
MRKPEDNDFASRRNAAAKAKAAQLEAHRAAKEAAESTRVERQEERIGIAAARDLRRAERDQAKQEEQARVKADELREQAEVIAAANAEADARETALNDRVSRVFEDEAVRKAQRDQRYADRKSRK